MKYLKPLTKEKGTAGIEILIEIVIGLFILGVLVFCITLMGSEVADSETFYDTITTTLTNVSTSTVVNDTGRANPMGGSVNASLRNCALTVTNAYNITGNGVPIASANYTVIDNCWINFSSASGSDGVNYENNTWNITGSWSYSREDDSVLSINDTYQEIGNVVDWFPIIIIFGAIVVLILLTVLIIRTVKTSGYGGGGGTGSGYGGRMGMRDSA